MRHVRLIAFPDLEGSATRQSALSAKLFSYKGLLKLELLQLVQKLNGGGKGVKF